MSTRTGIQPLHRLDLGSFGRVFAARRPHPRRIQLVCNPADDTAFATRAEAFLASGVASPDGLQRLLRERYPRVLVRPRGLSNEEFDAWYVYRDGSWTRSGAVDEGGTR